MPTAELFDGTQLQFEDGTPDHVIERVAREQTDRIRTEQARKPLPADVKPSAGRDAGVSVESHFPQNAEGPAAGLASVRSARQAVQRQRDTPAVAPETASVLDQPSADLGPRSGTMSDAEYQANYGSNAKPKDQPRVGGDPRDTIQNSPMPAVVGGNIRRALGSGVPAAAVEGTLSGLSSIAKVVPGMVAGAADLADKAGLPGAEAVRDFSLGQARIADQFGDAVQGQGGDYYTKLVGNVFNSVAQNIPVIAFGLPGAAEIAGGKAVATVAANKARDNAMKALFTQTAGQEYADSRNSGFDPGESAARAGIFGAAEVLGERFGFHEQMAVLRAAVGKKQLGSHELGRVLATEMMKEIPGEELTTAIEFLADKYGPAAKNPKATLADYLEQAADTAVQTIGQTALMGAPAALKGTYQRADAVAAYDSAKLAGLHVTPPYTTDAPDAQRAKTVGIFNAVAAQYGMDPEAVKRATEVAKGMPAADVGPFLAKLTGALQKRNLVAKPVEQHAVDVLTAGPIDDPKVIEAKAKDAEKAAQPSTVPGEPKEIVSREATAEEDLTGLSEPSTATGPSIDEAAHQAAHSPTNDLPEPTDAQKEAGNYQKGHVKVAGLDISVENPEGSTRSGVGADGKVWSNDLKHHYGYIRGTIGQDGEHIDTFIKPGTPTDFNGTAFVVDQIDPATGQPDEHKVMLGFDSIEEARDAYHANYHQGWGGLGGIHAAPIADLKNWIATGDTTKPYGPAQPNVQPIAGEPAGGGAGRSAEPAGSRGNLGPGADGDQRRGGAAAAPVAGGRTAEPVRDAGGDAKPVARAIALVGPMPNSAKPLELRPNKDGSSTAWHDGHEVLDFEQGTPVQIPAGTSDAAALQIVKDSGAFGRRARYFEAPKQSAAALEAAPANAPSAAAPKPADSRVKASTPGSATSDAFLERKRAEKEAANATAKVDTAAPSVEAKPEVAATAPPAQPPTPVTRKLSDKEAFAQDYKAFEDRDVVRPVQIADTGQTATLKLAAAKAMRDLDARLKTLNELKACIGRHA